MHREISREFRHFAVTKAIRFLENRSMVRRRKIYAKYEEVL